MGVSALEWWEPWGSSRLKRDSFDWRSKEPPGLGVRSLDPCTNPKPKEEELFTSNIDGPVGVLPLLAVFKTQ